VLLIHAHFAASGGRHGAERANLALKASENQNGDKRAPAKSCRETCPGTLGHVDWRTGEPGSAMQPTKERPMFQTVARMAKWVRYRSCWVPRYFRATAANYEFAVDWQFAWAP